MAWQDSCMSSNSFFVTAVINGFSRGFDCFSKIRVADGTFRDQIDPATEKPLQRGGQIKIGVGIICR